MTEVAHSHVKSYLVVYATLVLLVILTVAAALVPTGVFALPIALSIAGTKALLIVAIFMHAKDETPLVRIFAAAGAFWLLLMFTFLFADYVTRHPNRAAEHSQFEAPFGAIPAGHATEPNNAAPEHAAH